MYSPVCRICGRKEHLETQYKDVVTESLVNQFVRRVIKVLRSKEGWREEVDSLAEFGS